MSCGPKCNQEPGHHGKHDFEGVWVDGRLVSASEVPAKPADRISRLKAMISGLPADSIIALVVAELEDHQAQLEELDL